MLYILLSLGVFLPVFIGYGKLTAVYTGVLFPGIAAQLFLGMLTLSTLFTLSAFFFPLNIYLEIPVLSLGIISFFYYKQHLDFGNFLKSNSRLFGALTLIILLFGSFYPFILDHFGYYVPTVHWLSEFGITKGIANLDLLLGQMSFWHILQAGFSNFTDLFLRLNSVVMVFYTIYILEKKSWLHLLFFPVLLLFTQSPSPDLPAIIISLVILNEILDQNKNVKLLFLMSIFIFAIKPTMIWVPVLAFLYAFFIQKAHFKILLPGLFLLAVFIFKNIWTFGFPVFPVSVLDLQLSWKPNAALLATSSEVALQKTYDMQYSAAEIKNFTAWQYVKNWLFLPGIKGVIHCLFIFSLVVFSFYTLHVRSKMTGILWISIFIKSILILLFSAQYRFFIDVFFVIFFIIFYRSERKKIIFYSSGILITAALFIFSFPKLLQSAIPSFRLANYMSGIKTEQIMQPATFELNNYTVHTIGNLKFNTVKNYPFTFDTPMPAISPAFLKEDSDAGIFPQKIGKNYQQGFRWKKLSSREQKKLKEILKQLGY